MVTRVLVIGGGQNAEHDVSLASASAVAAALRLGDHEVRCVTIDGAGRWRADGVPPGATVADSLTQALPLLGWADVVFPAVHGAPGEDGSLAALCALAGVRVKGGIGQHAPPVGDPEQIGNWDARSEGLSDVLLRKQKSWIARGSLVANTPAFAGVGESDADGCPYPRSRLALWARPIRGPNPCAAS